MTLSTGDTVLLSIALADFIGIFLWIGVCLHLAYTQADVMLEHLKNSPAITIWAPILHAGPWGKLMFIGGVCGLITFPGYQLKKGNVSAEDLAGFPTALKRKLVFLQWSMIGLLLVMVTFGIAIKLGLI
jgi:hypothetical protein